MIKRIDEDTIEITTSKTVKISDLEVKKMGLQAIDVSAKEHNKWRRTLPIDKQNSVLDLPEMEQEIVVLQKEVDEYKTMKIEPKIKVL